MTDFEETLIKDMNSKLIELNAKVEEMSSVLGKFGLDFITKIGQTNLKIRTLTDKIEGLDKATITIKGLLPQLNKIIENQDNLEMEIDLLKSLVQKCTSSSINETRDASIQRNESITSNKQSIVEKFDALKQKVDQNEDPKTIMEELDSLQKDLFETTGGHRILYDISQFLKKLKVGTIDSALKEEIKEKINFWKNKV